MKLSARPKACVPVLAAFLLAVGSLSTLSCASRAQDAAQNPPARVGRLALIDGTVSYHTADQNYWQAARRNYPVTTGQAFWTEPNAHAAIDVAGNRIYLDISTELDISGLDDATAQFSLPQGAVFLALRSLDQDRPYEVQMARAAVTLAAAGRYEVIAGDTEHASQVTVFDGSAHVSGNGLDLNVRAGETAVLSGEQTIQAQVSAAGPADAFVAWVETQEQLHRRKAPAVASEMTGAAELGAYGRWARAARYGDIWYPDVAAGWAPYREGYWAWVEPWGWTWIDDEAWGFAPFHYGRWLLVDDRWAWMPGSEASATDEPIAAFYAPALVTFFAAADTCAWVPLGPDEAYVPPYPVSLGYFHGINAAYVSDIRTRERITTERTRINQYANQRAITAVPNSVVSRSQSVASHARATSAARLANARPILGTHAVRPIATTAGVSPSVAHRLGIASGALAAAQAQMRAPGPPIHTVAPAATARVAPQRTLAPAAQHATAPSAPQPTRQAPALAQPGATHHLPGSPVGQAGANGPAAVSKPPAPAQAAPPAASAPRPAPSAVARPSPRVPAAPAAPPPETAGRAVPHAPSAASPSRPTPPPAVAHPAPQAPAAARVAPPPRPQAAAPRAPTPPAVVHRQAPPAAPHLAPPPTTVGRAPPPRAPIAAPPRPAPPPVVHAAPSAPVPHAAPPGTVGRAPPPAAAAPPAHAPAPPAGPGRQHH
jgi:hypothetical protein